MQMNYLLLLSDWFLSDEKIPQFVWVRKAGNFLCGLWKAMENDKNDQFVNKKAINTLVIV